MNALEKLADKGAHFVLCQYSKRPVQKGWQKRKPELSEITEWLDADTTNQVGIIPWSLGLTVLDVDEGNAELLTEQYAPLVVLPTRREHGRHVYYYDVSARRNGKWAWQGLSGDLRGGSGFVVLWHDGIDRLLGALESDESGVAFPCEEMFPASK